MPLFAKICGSLMLAAALSLTAFAACADDPAPT
jgi:hypothetical protein